jgi:uncharacterized RDD family membrane protein YckC
LKNENPNHCSLLRQFAAIFYDTLLLIAIFFVASLILLPLIGETGIESGNIFYNAFLLLLAYLYFCWHWVDGKQTLGMRSWKIEVINETDTPLNWKQASFRYFAALLSLLLLGLGFIWALFDKEKLTLHDRLSKTKLIVNKNN